MDATADATKNTVLCTNLVDFLKEAEKVGHCFRCGYPVDPNTDEWATLAQADSKVGNDYLIGGVLCEGCATSWYEWVQAAKPCACPGCPQQEEDGADS